jgi:hypothetical protein
MDWAKKGPVSEDAFSRVQKHIIGSSKRSNTSDDTLVIPGFGDGVLNQNHLVDRKGLEGSTRLVLAFFHQFLSAICSRFGIGDVKVIGAWKMRKLTSEASAKEHLCWGFSGHVGCVSKLKKSRGKFIKVFIHFLQEKLHLLDCRLTKAIALRVVRARILMHDIMLLAEFIKFGPVLGPVVRSQAFWPTKGVEPLSQDLNDCSAGKFG